MKNGGGLLNLSHNDQMKQSKKNLSIVFRILDNLTKEGDKFNDWDHPSRKIWLISGIVA